METAVKNLYYALGEACYAMAMADGAIQVEERTMLSDILKKEFSQSISKDIIETEIIFKLFSKDLTDTQTAMNWAIKEIKANSHYFSTDMKCHFISTIIKVADSFPPIVKKEKALLMKFIEEVIDIKEDKLLSSKTADKK
ncbi:hypothetical protein [Aurantibacillus circumpalustris]|uniref:hypothetical protein n=1 Tax=Aurantibacillus circumpalustris TaxID=3036359 RepID=UPI00295AE8D6|nr:hypothetical protein [Aurantibacillus circumpalustris]